MPKGLALRHGFAASEGKYVAFTDADLPYGLEIINKMYRTMEGNRTVALLFGSRSHSLSKSSSYGWLRSAGRNFFSNVVKNLVISDVKDTQCGVKMLRADLAHRTAVSAMANRFAFDIEIFAIARQNQLQYQDFPVTLSHRKESSVRLIKDTLLMLYDIVKIRLRMQQHFYAQTSSVDPESIRTIK